MLACRTSWVVAWVWFSCVLFPGEIYCSCLLIDAVAPDNLGVIVSGWFEFTVYKQVFQ